MWVKIPQALQLAPTYRSPEPILGGADAPERNPPSEGRDMIGLVRLVPRSGHSGACTVMDQLPAPPAARISACAARCRDADEVGETLEWHTRLAAARPDVPLGLAAEAADSAPLLARHPLPLAFLISPSDLVGGALPESAWRPLVDASVVGVLLEEVLVEVGPADEGTRAVLRSLVARGAHGSTVARAASDVGVSTETVRRRLRTTGYSPNAVLRWARHRAFEVRISLGAHRSASLLAGGWSSHEQRRKARSRLSGMAPQRVFDVASRKEPRTTFESHR